MNTILCPTDFSHNGDDALQYSLALAEKIKAKVILLHVYESAVVLTEMPMPAVFAADKEVHDAALKQLAATKKKAQENFPSVEMKTIVEEGSAYSHIIKNAREHKADLIVMGTTGTGKVERLIIGSTVSQVIQHAGCPVLCIPKGTAHSKLKKIAFATDLQEDNLTAAASLVAFAKLFDAEIIFVFVDDKHLIHSNKHISDITHTIKDKIKYPKISGYVCNDTHITAGIEYFLKHHEADMLAMFTHRKKFPDSLFHPSVTKAMANKTTLPLLVIERADKVIS